MSTDAVNTEEVPLYLGEIVSRGWTLKASNRAIGAEPVSCTWSILSGTSVTIADPVFSVDAVSIFITTALVGCSVVRAAVLYTDDQVLNYYFIVDVTDVTC